MAIYPKIVTSLYIVQCIVSVLSFVKLPLYVEKALLMTRISVAITLFMGKDCRKLTLLWRKGCLVPVNRSEHPILKKLRCSYQNSMYLATSSFTLLLFSILKSMNSSFFIQPFSDSLTGLTVGFLLTFYLLTNALHYTIVSLWKQTSSTYQ